MPNLARAILVIVAVFVVAVGITLVVRKRTARVEAPGPALSSADLRIKDVDLEEVTNGVRWRLRAEQALMYDQEGRTNLRNLTVRVFQRFVRPSWSYIRACSARSRKRTPLVTSSRSTSLIRRSADDSAGPSDSTRAVRFRTTSVIPTATTNTATITRIARARLGMEF